MPLPLLTRLPIRVSLPLVMVGIVLVTAIGSTQIATRSLSAHIEAQLDLIGQTYLDGLTASVMPAVLERDIGGIERALDEVLRVHQGLEERRLFLFDAGWNVVARADRDPPDDGGDGDGLPTDLRERARGHLLDTARGTYWVWRPLVDARGLEAGSMTVVASLDIADYAAERRALWRRVALFDVSLVIVCALVGLLLMRRLLRPVTLLTRHLQQGGDAAPMPIAESRASAGDKETVQLVHAYNRMAAAARERETMSALLAQQEREALLGRMAATLAHEVRNPLAGVITAIETLRKFGDRKEVRAEALDFMERGMRALAEVTDATLATHRPADDARGFGPQDVFDARRLVLPQAERAGVALHVVSDLEAPVPIAGGEVRQVLLNLLLNAVEASSAKGTVQLRCTADARHLRLEVSDEGAGLPDKVARSLERGTEPEGSEGLGMAVVARLVQRLRGRVAVDAHAGCGTHIVLELPLDVPLEAALHAEPEPST